jgi:hypothetical protein
MKTDYKSADQDNCTPNIETASVDRFEPISTLLEQCESRWQEKASSALINSLGTSQAI